MADPQRNSNFPPNPNPQRTNPYSNPNPSFPTPNPNPQRTNPNPPNPNYPPPSPRTNPNPNPQRTNPNPNPQRTNPNPNPQRTNSNAPNPTLQPDPPRSAVEDTVGDIPEGFPAADLIKILLQYISTSHSSTKRNVLTTKAIIDQSTRVYIGIISLMSKVHSASSAADWSSFEKYTKAIGPLEKLLLKFALEKANPPHVPPNAETATCITFLESWISDRKMIVDTLTSFDSDVFRGLLDTAALVETAPRKRDDLTTLEELTEEIESTSLVDEDIMDRTADNQTPVSTVKADVEAIKDAISIDDAYDEKRTGMAVQSIMLICIPFVVLEFDERDANTDDYLRSGKVWKEMKGFSDFLKDFVTSKTITTEALDTKFTALKGLLSQTGVIGPFLVQVITLMRLAGQVRRPFHGRAVAIAKMWFHLNSQERVANEQTRGGRVALRSEIDKAATALEHASRDIKDVRGIETSVIEELDRNFNNAVAKLPDLFESYSTKEKWLEYKSDYDSAKIIDNEHLALFKAKISKMDA